MTPGDSVAALFIDPAGPYPGLVADVWGVDRDATRYDGDLSVVAHPPCKRWGRFWHRDGSTEPGQDGGMFASCLESVRRVGGVIEHPASSHAFAHFGLPRPSGGAWIRGLEAGIWVTEIAQRNYGHRARKLSWMIYIGRNPPAPMDWSTPAPPAAYMCPPGRCSPGKPRRLCPCKVCREVMPGPRRPPPPELSKLERRATPRPFADTLIELAARCGGPARGCSGLRVSAGACA